MTRRTLPDAPQEVGRLDDEVKWRPSAKWVAIAVLVVAAVPIAVTSLVLAGWLVTGGRDDPNRDVRRSSAAVFEAIEIVPSHRVVREWDGRDGHSGADLAVAGGLSPGDVELPAGYTGEDTTWSDELATFEGPDPLRPDHRCTVSAYRISDPVFQIEPGQVPVRLTAYCGMIE